jgi:hypothetical protein
MDLSSYITKDGNFFYFDLVDSSTGTAISTIDYQDGDIIKWTWDNKKMLGKLRYAGTHLFVIENPKVI